MKRSGQKIPHVAEIAWVLGVTLCALGVCLSANSGFGVSMIAAPSLILFTFLSRFFPALTFGITEYILQGVLMVLLAVCLRRFKWKYPLAFLTGVLYGLSLDGWRLLFGQTVYATMPLRIVSAVAGALISTFAIALALRTYLPQQVYEMVVTEIVDKYGFSVNKVKWCYDLSSLAVAVIMMLCFFRKFDTGLIGVTTLVLTFVNTPLITMYGKIVDRCFTFDSAFPKFRAWFDRTLN